MPPGEKGIDISGSGDEETSSGSDCGADKKWQMGKNTYTVVLRRFQGDPIRLLKKHTWIHLEKCHQKSIKSPKSNERIKNSANLKFTGQRSIKIRRQISAILIDRGFSLSQVKKYEKAAVLFFGSICKRNRHTLKKLNFQSVKTQVTTVIYDLRARRIFPPSCIHENGQQSNHENNAPEIMENAANYEMDKFPDNNIRPTLSDSNINTQVRENIQITEPRTEISSDNLTTRSRRLRKAKVIFTLQLSKRRLYCLCRDIFRLRDLPMVQCSVLNCNEWYHYETKNCVTDYHGQDFYECPPCTKSKAKGNRAKIPEHKNGQNENDKFSSPPRNGMEKGAYVSPGSVEQCEEHASHESQSISNTTLVEDIDPSVSNLSEEEDQNWNNRIGKIENLSFSLPSIFATASIEEKDISYLPPSEYTITISPEDWAVLYDDKNQKFFKRVWPPIINKYVSEKSNPCSFNARDNVVSGSRDYFCKFRGKCSGDCKMSFNVFVMKKPVPGHPVEAFVKANGEFSLLQNKQTGRQLRSLDRLKMFDCLQHESAKRIVIKNHGSASPLHHLHKNNAQKSESQLRVLKHEGVTKLRSSPSLYEDMGNLKNDMIKKINPGGILKGYIQSYSVEPLICGLYRENNIRIYCDLLRSSKSTYLYLDSTGSICCKVNKNAKKTYLYSIMARFPGLQIKGSLQLAEFLTNSHDVPTVSSCLRKLLHDIQKVKRISAIGQMVCIDFSFCLLHSLSEAWNKEDLAVYMNRSWEMGKDEKRAEIMWSKEKICIHLCSAHIIKSFLNILHKKGIKKKIKDVGIKCFVKLLQSGTLEKFQHICNIIIRLFGSEYMSCNAIDELIAFFSKADAGMILEERDGIETDQELKPKSSKQKKDEKTLKSRSPFYKYFVTARKSFEIAKTDKGEKNKNPYYNVIYLNILQNTYIAYFCFWGAMVPRILLDRNFTHHTNNAVESYFSNLKNQLHVQRYLYTTDFIREHEIITLGLLRKFEQNNRWSTKRGSPKKRKKKLTEEVENAEEIWSQKREDKRQKRVSKYLKPTDAVENENFVAKEKLSQNNCIEISDSEVEILNESVFKIPVDGVVIVDDELLSLFGKGKTSWLCDSIINAFINLIKLDYVEKMDGIFVTGTFFLWLSEDKKLHRLESMLGKIPSNTRLLICPLLYINHWILAAVDLMKFLIYDFDSLPNYISKKAKENFYDSFKEFLEIKYKKQSWAPIKTVSVSKQRNGYQCGDHMLLTIESIVNDGLKSVVVFTNEFIDGFRIRVLKRFLQNSITGNNLLEMGHSDAVLVKMVSSMIKKNKLLFKSRKLVPTKKSTNIN